MSEPGERALDDWVDGFMEYTSVLQSPPLFRRWAAYSTIAGVLERRVWTKLAGSRLYPNLLVLLVARPGVGKSMAIEEVYDFWSKLIDYNVAPMGMTKAAFVDQLMDKHKFFNYDGRPVGYNAMLVAAREFGTLLPEYDSRFLNVINDVYDCHESPFEERTRKDGLKTIDRAHVSIITGTQPKYLGGILPDAAYGMGFTSRTIMVYAWEEVVIDLFESADRDDELHKKLTSDLDQMTTLVGRFKWEKAPKDFIEDWNRHKYRDAPKHPKLFDYNPRRIMHAVKIAMSFSVSRSNEMLVTMEDFMKARELLIETEDLMPEIFKEMIISQDASEIDEVHAFMFNYCRTLRVESVPEQDLMHFMSRKIPVNRIEYFMKTLQSAGMIRAEGPNIPGGRSYRPLATVTQLK